MDYFLLALKKYAVFSGRASRAEYWYFALFSFLIGLILGFVDSSVSITSNGMGILSMLFSLAFFIPSLAVGTRRLHDINKSGFWWLIILVPFIGGIVLLVFFATDSQPGDNQYGPNPKGIMGIPQAPMGRL